MTRYRLNHPDVIQETVEGEAIVIHTPSGAYYSLEGTGAYAWNALLEGNTPAEVASAYADTDGTVPAAVAAALQQFAEQLEKEQLLLPADAAAGSATLPPPPQPFAVPTFQKFTDMQELLLVDPIHEVDPQTGWPQHRDSD